MRGVSLIEILIVIGVIIILLALSVPGFIFFQKESDLTNDAEEIITILGLAQSKTLASEGSEQYGVYFDNSSSPDQCILFKGQDFVSRDIAADEVYVFSSAVEIYDISLGGANEVVFEELTGFTAQSGSVSLRLISDNAKTKTIYVEESGYVGFEAPVLPGAGRVADSRHIHFDYTRLIDTATETITLNVGTASEVIAISDFLNAGQFSWEGEIDGQVLKIHTHRLNNPDTQFCIHRDRRYNNKILTVSISGDPGSLAEYLTDGSLNPPGSGNVGPYEEQ